MRKVSTKKINIILLLSLAVAGIISAAVISHRSFEHTLLATSIEGHELVPFASAMRTYSYMLGGAAVLLLVVFVWGGMLWHANEQRGLLMAAEKQANRLLEEKNRELSAEIAQRRATEDELQEIQRRQKALLDNIPDMVWMKDKDGRFIIANQAVSRNSGLPFSRIIGHSDIEIWSEELGKDYSAGDRAVMGDGIPRKFVEPNGDKTSGTQRWIETIKTALCDKDNTVIGTVGIARDITERKNYEDYLTKLNRMFLDIGPNFERNIQKMVTNCGELLSADIVFFNRIKGTRPVFSAGWKVPPQFPHEIQCALSAELAAARGKEMQVMRDLPSSRWASQYPAIRELGLKTFAGCLLKCSGENMGMLSILYTRDVKLSENDKRLLEIIASAICIEEERRQIDEKLKAKMFDLERFNRFAVDRELKMIELKKKLSAYAARETA